MREKNERINELVMETNFSEKKFKGKTNNVIHQTPRMMISVHVYMCINM